MCYNLGLLFYRGPFGGFYECSGAYAFRYRNVLLHYTGGLYLGYLFGQKIQVFKTSIDGGGLISFFPNGADKPPADRIAKYWNPKLTVLGAGANIEDVWLSGFLLGGSFNFYF